MHSFFFYILFSPPVCFDILPKFPVQGWQLSNEDQENLKQVTTLESRVQLAYLLQTVPIMPRLFTRVEDSNKRTSESLRASKDTLSASENIFEAVLKLQEDMSELKSEIKELCERLKSSLISTQRISVNDPVGFENTFPQMPFQCNEAAQEFFDNKNEEFVKKRGLLVAG